MNDELKSKILSAAEWLTLHDLGLQLNTNIDLITSLVDSWTKDNLIFAIEHNDERLIPAYALDSLGKPIPVIQNVLTIFNGKKSVWAIAAWFASINGWLGGITPIEAISSNPEGITAAAMAEVSSAEHG
tara:strand:+ start:578 stop:964 length:387 start_codon:yes stop_codon:yes gene_type:complete